MFWTQLGIILAIVLISLVLFNFLRPYIFKYNVKKHHLIILLIIFFILPPFLGNLYKLPIVQWLQMIIVSLITLIFVDLISFEKINKKKEVIGRPKPKPRRAKNNK